MIVPMKKVAVITQPKDAATILSRLRSLGVVHVEHKEPPKGTELDMIQEDLSLINQALEILSEPEFVKVAGEKTNITADDPKFIAKHVIDLHKRFDQLGEYSRGIKNTIAEWQAWGDFDPDDLARLREKGIFIRLYQIPAKEIKNLPAGVITKQLFSSAGLINCAVICRENIEIPFQEISLPKMGLTKMRNRLYEDSRLMEIIADDICKYVSYCSSLVKVKARLEKDLEFYQALKGMSGTEEIVYLSGYVPIDAVRLLRETARQQNWGLSVKEPSAGDQVPTLIRNPKWISVISPVFKLIEVIPGYRELDISLWFLIFFSIFFGMLIGDAGYGMVFFILTLLSRKKLGKKLKSASIFNLFYVLSFCAIVWGVLTGTFFGQEWLGGWVKPVIPALRDDKNIQALCFLLGATHLSVAHLWRAILKAPSLVALSDIGWVVIIWGGFFLAKVLILGEDFPELGKWFFIIGPVLVVFFTSPRRNILKGVGSGMGDLLLNFVNSFTDVVSYIRLFAVGLATVAVADSFNKMAMDIGYNGFINGIITTLIILLGHALNILLGPMSVLVHGLRLNVLEFCSHLDIKWSGFAYRPLREEAVG